MGVCGNVCCVAAVVKNSVFFSLGVLKYVVFCTRVAWACLVCFLLFKEEGSSPVSLQLLRGGIWACMRCPCLCLCWVLG